MNSQQKILYSMENDFGLNLSIMRLNLRQSCVFLIKLKRIGQSTDEFAFKS